MEDNWGYHLQTIEAHGIGPYHPTALAFSHDSTMVAAAGMIGMGIWHVDTGDRLQELNSGTNVEFSSSIAFSYDSSRVAVISMDGKVQAWRVGTGECVQTLDILACDGLKSVVFSNDSLLAASAADKTSMKIWRVDTGDCVRTLESSAPVTWQAISGDTALVASVSDNGLLQIWRVDTGECIDIPVEECDYRSSAKVVFSQDAKLVAVASPNERGKTVRMWRADTGEYLQRLEDIVSRKSGNNPRPMTFSHDSALLASVSGTVIKIWRVDTGECIQIIPTFSDIQTLVFSHDSTMIASGCNDETVRIWRVDSRQHLGAKISHSDAVQSISFSDDSSLILSSSYDGTIRIWCANTGMCLHTLEAANSRFTCAAFSHDSMFVASTSDHDIIRIWSVETGKCVQKLEGHTGSIHSVQFSYDSALIASTSLDKTVRIWSLDKRKCVLKLESDGVAIALFSYDSALVALCSDYAVRIRCVKTGTCIHELEGCRGAMAFSRDSALIASTSKSRGIEIWSIKTGRRVQTLPNSGNDVSSVVFSYDSALLASAHLDSIRIWSISTGECKQIVFYETSLTQPEFNQQGSHILTATAAFRIVDSLSGDTVIHTERCGVGISEYGYAVTWKGKKVLWLPPEHRSYCSVVSGSTIAMGSRSGTVAILKLSADCLGV